MAIRLVNPWGTPLGYLEADSTQTYVSGAPAFAELVAGAAPTDSNATKVMPTGAAATFIGIVDDQTNTQDANPVSVSGKGVVQTEEGVSNVILPGIATHAASDRITVWTGGIFATSEVNTIIETNGTFAPDPGATHPNPGDPVYVGDNLAKFTFDNTVAGAREVGTFLGYRQVEADTANSGLGTDRHTLAVILLK